MVLTILAVRGQVAGAEPPLQVVDIGGEGLAEAAERNGGAVGGRAAVLSTLGNLDDRARNRSGTSPPPLLGDYHRDPVTTL